MAKYLDKVQALIAIFKHFGISHIPWCENAHNDTLFRLATSVDRTFSRTYIKYLEASRIKEAKMVQQVDVEPSWIDCFVKYLIDDTILDDPPKGKKFKWKASKYVVWDGQLYQKSFSFQLLKYLQPSEVNYTLREIYEGIYGNHLGPNPWCTKT